MTFLKDSEIIISVIVAIHNEERYLKSCIPSLVSQIYPSEKYEIILIDDGSTDKSSSICHDYIEMYSKQLPQLQYHFIHHSGLSVARNTGISVSKGRIIAFIDADAVASDQWLSKLEESFDNPSVGVVGGQLEPLTSSNFLAKFLVAIHYDLISVIGANMAFRRSVFVDVGGFYPVFTYRGDEADIIRRVKHKSRHEIVHNSQAFVYHEFPRTLGRWLKERWTSGKLWHVHYKVESMWGKKYSLYQIILTLYKRLMNICLALILLSLVFSVTWMQKIILVFALPILIHRYIWPGSLTSRLWHSLNQRFEYFKAGLMFPLSLICSYLGIIVDDLAFIFYIFRRNSINKLPSIPWSL